MSVPLPFEFGSETPTPPPHTLVITVAHVQYVCDRYYNVWIRRSVYLQCEVLFGFTKIPVTIISLTLFLIPTTSSSTTMPQCQEETTVTRGNTQRRTETPDCDNHRGATCLWRGRTALLASVPCVGRDPTSGVTLLRGKRVTFPTKTSYPSCNEGQSRHFLVVGWDSVQLQGGDAQTNKQTETCTQRGEVTIMDKHDVMWWSSPSTSTPPEQWITFLTVNPVWLA